MSDVIPTLVQSLTSTCLHLKEIKNAYKITLRLILQNKSVITNFTDALNFWSIPRETYEESLALIQGKSANFEPSEDYEY